MTTPEDSPTPPAMRKYVPPVLRHLTRAAARRPALVLYLIAIAALGWKWLSPFASTQRNAGWSDVLLALAALAWLLERIRAGSWPRLRAFHLGLALYVAAGAFSLAFAADRPLGETNLLIMAELAVLAVLSSEFGSDPLGRRALVLTVVGLSLATAALAVAGLALFYAGAHTSLTSLYGELTSSDRYARVAAGFESATLLGSYCIFASAVVAGGSDFLPRRLVLLTQLALAALVVATLSRAILAFLAAVAIREGFREGRSAWARRAAVGVVAAVVLLLVGLSVGRLELDPTRPETITYYAPQPHGRRQAAVTSAESLADDPLTGVGPGSLTGTAKGFPSRAHLTPLNVAATLGLPALAALTFLLLSLWRNRRRPTPLATWSGMAGLGIDGLALDIDHFRHVWVMIGLADADRQERPSGPRNAS